MQLLIDNGQTNLKPEMASHMKSYSQLARTAKQFHVARRAVGRYRTLVDDNALWLLEMAKVQWDSDEHDDALRYSSVLLKHLGIYTYICTARLLPVFIVRKDEG